MNERTGYENDTLDKLLDRLSEVGNFERAGFGFPLDRVKIVSKHLSGAGEKDPFTDLTVGEEVHPDDFLKGMTRLYRQSWFDPLIAELRRRLKVADKLDERKAESASLRTQNTEARAKLENLQREAREIEVRIQSLRSAEEGMRRTKGELSQEITAMHQKRAILAGDLPTEVKASKRKLEL